MNFGKQETDIMTTDEQYMRKAIAEAEQAAAEQALKKLELE